MNRCIFVRVVGPTIVAGAWSLSAVGQHVDVMPVRVAGEPARIETGAFDFGAFQVVGLPPLRVFEGDLDEPVPGVGLLAGESGFTSLSATAAAALLKGTGYTHLPGGVAVRFDFNAFSLGGQPAANLWYWDGIDVNGNGDYSDDIQFAPAAGVQLSFERSAGLFRATVDGGPAAVAGFVIGTTLLDNPGSADDETGFLHVDLDVLLEDGDGGPFTALPLGVYALSLTLRDDGGATSEPIFWVYNGGLGEDGEPAVEAAVAYVPEPASATLLVLSSATLLRRRG